MSLLDDDCKKVFAKYDLNDNSRLEKEEMLRLLKDISEETGVRIPCEEEVMAIFKNYDVNGDGSISLKEFESLFNDLKKLNE